MVEMSRILKEGLTQKERELLDTIIRSNGDLNKACEKLDIKADTGRQRLYRLRMRCERARAFIQEYERYRLRIADAGATLYL